MVWKSKYRIKLVLSTVLIFGLLGMVMLNFTSNSRAATADDYKDHVGYRHGLWYVGTFLPAQSEERVICIQTGNEVPKYLSENNKIVEDPISAYALWKYGNTRDNAIASGLWWLLQDRQAMASTSSKWPGHNRLETKKKKLTEAERKASLAKRDEILAEAEKFSGPYAVKVDFIGADKWQAKGKITASIVSKSGHKVPGLRGKITLINAVFSDGSKSKDFQSQDKETEFEYQAISDGKIKTEITFETAATTIKINQPANSNANRDQIWQHVVLVSGSSASISATAEATVKLAWEPSLTTKVDVVYLKTGEEIKDQAEVIGGKPGAKFSGKFYFYGVKEDPTKNPRPKDIKAFAEVPYESTFDEQGKAKFTVSAKIPKDLAAQFFTVVGTITADSKSGIKGFEAKWGETAESGLILQPQLKSKVARAEVKVHEEVSDTWWIYQIPPGFEGKKLDLELQSRVLGPLPKENGKCPVGESAWSKAPVAMESEFFKLESGKNAKFGKNGELEAVAGAFKPNKAGSCYSFAGNLRIKEGNKVVAEFLHGLGEAEQGFYVPLEKINTGQGIKNHAAFLGAGVLLLGGFGSRVLRRRKSGKRYQN